MFLEDRQQQAAYAIVLLGIALIVALFPFASGLLAIPVLYVVFKPAYTRVRRHAQPRLAAAIVTGLGVLFLMVPLVLVAVIVAHQAQSLAAPNRESWRPKPLPPPSGKAKDGPVQGLLVVSDGAIGDVPVAGFDAVRGQGGHHEAATDHEHHHARPGHERVCVLILELGP